MSVYDSMTINNDTRDLSDKNAVKFSEAQSLTSAQKSTARGNIGAPPANGSAPDLTAGFAENLVPPMTENTVPYNFRTSDGPADILGIMYDKLVGGTLAWNQLLNPTGVNVSTGMTGITASIETGYVRITGTAGANGTASGTPAPTIPANHVYMILCDGASGFTWYRSGFSGDATTGNYVMRKHTASYSGNFTIKIDSGVTYDITARFSGFDITQMFGTAIADYVYGLEQATPGAGVAWFRKLFPKDYYAYDAGSLQSVQAASHDTVGFNQWDEVWELGGIADATGQNGNANDRIRSKNYIPCLPDTVYYFKLGGANWRIFYYDKDKDYITHTTSYNDNRQLTTPNNAYYMRFWKQVTTYSGGICINLSWSGYRNGEYEPYVKHSYALDDSLTLRGIPKLDAANNLYYDGDTYESDGTVTRKYGIVDLGTIEPIAASNVLNGWVFEISSMTQWVNNTSEIPDGIIPGYTAIAGMASAFTGGKEWTWRLSSATRGVLIADPDFTGKTSQQIMQMMSGVWLVYKKRTQDITTETADPFQSPQVVDDFGTEEYTDAGVIAATRDVAIPVGHVTQYPANLRDKLRHLPDLAYGDGKYIIQQSGEQMILVPSGIPAAPTGNGTYVLRVTVSGGNAVYSWVSAT